MRIRFLALLLVFLSFGLLGVETAFGRYAVRLAVNHSEKQCARYYVGHPFPEYELPPGWSVLGDAVPQFKMPPEQIASGIASDRFKKCPEGYTMMKKALNERKTGWAKEYGKEARPVRTRGCAWAPNPEFVH